MNSLPEWIGVALGVAALVVGVLAYRKQRGKARISYVVTTQADLVPPQLAEEITLGHNGKVLIEPSLAIVRLVSTGDLAIKASDFESGLRIQFKGVYEIVWAATSAVRPADLSPMIFVEGSDMVEIPAMLINPGDMIELQVLLSGGPDEVLMSGRITGLDLERLDRLPYPPGSGEEGEMLGFDRFMWYVFAPLAIVGGGAALALSVENVSVATRVLIGVIALLLLAADLWNTDRLVRRRRLWRPPTADEAADA